jgi:hypothetical protein
VRLRPDWVTIISELVPDDAGRPFRKVVGYHYDPPQTGPDEGPPVLFDVGEVAHWSPTPDPWAHFRGMSWLTPVLREVAADQAMTTHKIRYLQNAASPATVQAAGENRILIASGVPGIVIGSKEGLMAATYSNYEQAMRRFADITMRPLWRSACAALQQLVTPPAGSRLWFDVSDIAALRQGEKERADTLLVQAQAIAELVKFGYSPESAVAAVNGSNLALLEHPGPALQIMTSFPKASPPAAILPGDGQQNGAVVEPKAPAVNGQPMMMKGGPGG